ncbi:peptidyl-prolyl cis-trans isomerase [Anaeromyxobacter paludicola]|uniref:Periplasmic chaperone PpiD n=1 Tax=Anaeromyxobacter paludicola TaxID=2918171 RepID=A0ABM7XBL2_9BACT|nr:peptidyl-prolyl cis-trans isomerase [Anaeromyxobacter paludicola]BDG09250.1 hypothetical protein AMPC_23630 [Anaeromyxobacter paludicola]
MNHRTATATLLLAFATPGLARAQGAPAAAPTPAPAAAPAGAQREMRAYLVRDGREVQAPLFSEQSATLPVARVDDEEITLQQVTDALAAAHEEGHAAPTSQHDFKPVLDRLVDMKLCVIEAREMGLEDLPEVKQAIQDEETTQLLVRVRARAVAGVKPDPKVVERLYRDAVREYQVRSLLFAKEADAKAFQKALAAGGSFEALGAKLVAAKKAQGRLEAGYTGAAGVKPEVAKVIATAPAGAARVVKLADGFTVVQVLGARYPEVPAERARAEQRALEAARQSATFKYYDALAKQHARTDKKLLAKLDLEARKPGVAALRKDQRVLATIEGDKPLTVADLIRGMEEKFFHGIDAPIKERRANAAKPHVFQVVLRQRLVLAEARRQKIAESAEFRRYMAEFKEATLFSAYLERAIMPDVKVTEDEGRAYYAKHKADFATPAMYKLESLTFSSAQDAQAAFDKLRAGTDFRWLRANASGQVKEDQRKAQLDNTVVSATALPPELANQLSGARPGDCRLQAVEGQYFLVRLVSATPGQQQPYEAARAVIGKKLIGENLNRALRASNAKIRKSHAVAVYLTRIGY